MHPLGFVPHAASTSAEGGVMGCAASDGAGAASNAASVDEALEGEEIPTEEGRAEPGGSAASALLFEHPAVPLMPTATDKNQDSTRRIHGAR
jgi:hypothetical protein